MVYWGYNHNILYVVIGMDTIHGPPYGFAF